MSEHEHDLLANSNRKAFYKYSVSLVATADTVARYAGNTISKGLQAAETFSNEFSKNFSTSMADYTITDALNYSSTMSLFNASYSDTVAALLASFNSAAGPGGISRSLLRKLAPVFGQPVSIIFQQPLYQGQFSQQWKTTLVVPIYKGKGSRASASLSDILTPPIVSRLPQLRKA